MEGKNKSKFFTKRQSIFSKLRLIGSVFATSESCPGSTTPTPRKDDGDLCRLRPCVDSKSDCIKICTQQKKHAPSSDRGKTGAGITGSRTSRTGDNIDDYSSSTNPGLLRYIHNAAIYRMPQCFEGANVSVLQGGQSNWVLGHTMSFSSVSPGGYNFLLSYADKKNPSTLPYFVIKAAPGGQMSCELRVSPTQNTRATIVSQIANAELCSLETTFDVYFKNSTASIIAVNKESIAVHFLQALSKSISVGAEIVTKGKESEFSSVSGAFRWANPLQSFSATAGNRGLDVYYARAVRPYLTIAAMFEVGFAIRRSVATVAYEWRADKWTVRGSADSDGLVGATLQRALGGKNAELSCAISAILNHPNDKFRLGFGITAAIV